MSSVARKTLLCRSLRQPTLVRCRRARARPTIMPCPPKLPLRLLKILNKLETSKTLEPEATFSGWVSPRRRLLAIWVDAASIGGSSSGHGRIFALPSFVVLSITGMQMHLTPRELDKLMIHMLSDVALKRKGKGLKLNHPESVAVLCAYVLSPTHKISIGCIRSPRDQSLIWCSPRPFRWRIAPALQSRRGPVPTRR